MKAVIIKAHETNRDWKYMAVCQEHGFVLESQTKKALLNFDTTYFCDCCSGDCTPFCQNCNQAGE